MRVLHITTDDLGGAGLCCLRIHKSLLDVGIESKVVTLRNHLHVKEEYGYGFLKDKMSRLPSKLLRMMGLKLTERNEIMKLFLQNGGAYSLPKSSVNLLDFKWIEWADIIHLHWVNNYLDYPSFLSGINKPIVWTLHDENFFFGIAHYSDTLLPDHPLEQKYLRMKRDAISHVERMAVVLLSEFLRKKFEGDELLNGRMVRVINNPIETQDFKPLDRLVARRKLGLPEEDLLIGFTANQIFDERKGLKVLSKVVEGMEFVKGKKASILAIGGNDNKKSLSNVISIGVVKEASVMSEVLSACDFFAMPSTQEAFAQSPMEAMACGLPVVAFPVSGTSELINENNGVVCTDFKPEALCNGIKLLLSRKYDVSEIRQDMINRFSPEAIARKYVRLYEDISH